MIEIQNGPYTLKCYTADERDNPLRGHVFVGDKCVCRPFDRFFNYHEKPIDLTGARYYAKLDGTLINVWYHEGWHITTKKSFCSPYNGTTYQDAVRPLVPFDLLDPAYTYTFEFTSPHNRIVTPYEVDQLWLLQRRHNESGIEEVGLTGFLNAPEVYLPEYFNTLSDFDEGVVARTPFGKCKIKHKPYLEWHRKRFQDPHEMIVLGEFHDFQEFYPNMLVVNDRWQNLVASLKQYTWIHDMDRKSLAMQIKDHPLKSVLFRLYDHKTPFVDTRHMVKILESTCI